MVNFWLEANLTMEHDYQLLCIMKAQYWHAALFKCHGVTWLNNTGSLCEFIHSHNTTLYKVLKIS